MSETALLQVGGVDAGYGHVGVLRGVDLSVSAGTIVALVGSNGAGKLSPPRFRGHAEKEPNGRRGADGELEQTPVLDFKGH